MSAHDFNHKSVIPSLDACLLGTESQKLQGFYALTGTIHSSANTTFIYNQESQITYHRSVIGIFSSRYLANNNALIANTVKKLKSFQQ